MARQSALLQGGAGAAGRARWRAGGAPVVAAGAVFPCPHSCASDGHRPAPRMQWQSLPGSQTSLNGLQAFPASAGHRSRCCTTRQCAQRRPGGAVMPGLRQQSMHACLGRASSPGGNQSGRPLLAGGLAAVLAPSVRVLRPGAAQLRLLLCGWRARPAAEAAGKAAGRQHSRSVAAHSARVPLDRDLVLPSPPGQLLGEKLCRRRRAAAPCTRQGRQHGSRSETGVGTHGQTGRISCQAVVGRVMGRCG